MPVKKEKLVTKSDVDSSSSNLIFDVAKPGTLPPADATARPVIVANRVIMHDPMMVKPVVSKPDSAKSEPTDPAVTTNDSASIHGSKIVINPFYAQTASGTTGSSQPGTNKLTVDSDADGIVEDSEVQTLDSHAIGSAIQPAPAKSTSSEENRPKPSAESAPKASFGDDTAVASDPETTKQDKEAAELEASAKAQDELDTLIAEKAYFLPINAVELRRSKHVAIFGTLFILLLALVWANIALDAGYISIPGVNPVTHLFSE